MGPKRFGPIAGPYQTMQQVREASGDYSVPRCRGKVPILSLGRTMSKLQRTRVAIHHSYLTAREQANPALHRFLLDVVLYAKMFAF
jgi:hypothetical protein